MKLRLLFCTCLMFICFFSFYNLKAGSFVVNSVANAVGAAGAGTQTIRWAIAQCNAVPAGPHTITFDPTMVDPEFLGAPSLDLTASNVLIDGTVFPGYVCGDPQVAINCDAFNHWQWTGSNCTIKGVRIFGGIRFTASNNKILGCLFGFEFNGTCRTATGAEAAVHILGSTASNNTVGGFTACERNIIAGADYSCYIRIETSGNGNKFYGNYIGTDLTGLAGVGPGAGVGIKIESGNNHSFKGNSIGNIPSGATSYAVHLSGGTGDSIIDNNIGATSDRKFKLGFSIGSTALYFDAAGTGSIVRNNVIGNTAYLGNGGPSGCLVVCRYAGSAGITFDANYIGTDITLTKVAGLVAPWNGGAPWAGFYCYGSTGAQTITNNYIANSGWENTQYSHGLAIWGTTAGTWTISGNYIGVGPAGQDLGNGDAGLEILATGGGSVFNITGNYIGFNRGFRANGASGIRLVTAQTVNITGNYIGTLPGSQLDCGNYLAGICTEGTTVTGVTINNNTIAYNKTYGYYNYKNGTSKVTMSQNCFMCNTWEGIAFTASDGTTGNAGYGRSFGVTAPAVATVYASINPTTHPTWPSTIVAGAATWTLQGFAPPGSTVEIFQNHKCNCDAGIATGTGAVRAGQGADYIKNLICPASGAWTTTVTGGTVKDGFTVTATDLVAKTTSEFSPCVSSPISCLPPSTVTATGSGTGSGGAISGTSISPCVATSFTTTGTTTFFRTPCYNNYYYTWLKDGVIIYGPSLTYIDYTKLSAANPADDGNYVLRVSDGNVVTASCLVTSSPVVIDVVSCGLPVEWTSIYGLNAGEVNKLFWTTGIELRNNYFEIERIADDAKTFETIGMVSPKGSNSTYVFEDDKFEKGKINYYRIRQVEKDGNYDFSKTVAINTNISFEVKLFPNPAENSATVSLISEENTIYHYVINDMSGRLISDGNIEAAKGIFNAELDFHQLSDGVYVLSLRDATGKKAFLKLTLQR